MRIRHPNRFSVRMRAESKGVKAKVLKDSSSLNFKELIEMAILKGLWYSIFGNLNIVEAAKLLKRFVRAKESQKKGARKHLNNRNYHHLIPQSRGGDNGINNLGLMRMSRHRAWHMLFRNLTIEEVVRVLSSMSFEGRGSTKAAPFKYFAQWEPLLL